MSYSSLLDSYQEYISENVADINLSSLPLFTSAQQTDWENPSTTIELNNFAVIQIIEARKTEDIGLRQFYLELAIEALETALNQENHPLCVAHLGIIKSLTGEVHTAHQIEFSRLLDILPIIFEPQENSVSGLVYLPINNRNKAKNKESLKNIISLDNGYLQAFYLLIADCEQSQMVFYNSGGLRLLNLANNIIPNSVNIKLNLGISNLSNRQPEGLLYLHQARQLQPTNSNIIQALYLAYRDLNNVNLTNYYYEYGKKIYQDNPQHLQWMWTNLPLDNPFTYVNFDGNLFLAVEASFRSIVTSVILAQEDWFESEMEMWREEIKPEMVIIDVGANVGVYTFSAAQKVGKNGKVIAVEPFSGCVECLEETRKINQLNWVNICAGAAGEENKIVKLSLHQASELNEIIKDDSSPEGNYQEVECFTLDSLVEKYQLSTVDWLKLDAEGNEIEVLKGSSYILSEFKPKILYENIAGSQGSNIPVAEFLLSIGYELFYYQPFLKQLIPLQSLEELSGKLNIIAQHQNK
ncbi:methyltransferase [Geminocystis sp. NIES-3708]|uniref:FkbM family methyltransferase n=1 Tax=Geminocystis sp. NIES-3708 TaxID=1615909 RepID=UPI0005FC3F92|nr:FkbM family methyltransferase [Geminocystis sp. NIES-3708]BAQ61060.1 methyltransferase [Geminocystis sp. NIES-3708]